MQNTLITTYYTDELTDADSANQLFIEINQRHIACILLNNNKKMIVGFEFFTIIDDESLDFRELMSSIVSKSMLLNKGYTNPHIFFNNNQCVTVPLIKFDEELAGDYLNTMFGEDYESEVQIEHLTIMPGMMNVYRIYKVNAEVLKHKFPNATYHHTYSNLIKRVMGNAGDNDAGFLSVQFYDHCFIAVALKDGELHLIQTFEFENEDDIMYALLNISHQLSFDKQQMNLQFSGMIDSDSSIFERIKSTFNKMMVDEATIYGFAAGELGKPLYYFAPFLNLAL